MDWRIQSIILTAILALAIALVVTNICWAIVLHHAVTP